MNKTKNHGGLCTSLKPPWRGASWTKTKNKQTSKAQTADNLLLCCCIEWESTNKSPQVEFSKGSVLVVAPSSFSSVIPSLSLVSINPKPSPKDCLSTTVSLRYIFPTFSALVGKRFGAIHFWRGQNKAVPWPQHEWQPRPKHPIICTLAMPWSSVRLTEGGWQGESSSHHRFIQKLELHSSGTEIHQVSTQCSNCANTPRAASCRYERAGSQ